jgi:hypothetical protein
MAESSPEGAMKAIWHAVIPVLGAAMAWLAGWTGGVGSILATVLAIAVAVCGLVFSIMYKRYVGVLASGAKRKGTPERNGYDALRESLEAGGLPNRLYAERLTAFFGAVDRFFGDAGMADRTLFPHAFGLKAPAPLWTAPAYDRCMLLALIYPIAAVFIIWAISGHVGPAEAGLGLSELPPWRRAFAVAAVGLEIYALSRVATSESGRMARTVSEQEALRGHCSERGGGVQSPNMALPFSLWPAIHRGLSGSSRPRTRIMLLTVGMAKIACDCGCTPTENR